jgi:hypothetical protein
MTADTEILTALLRASAGQEKKKKTEATAAPTLESSLDMPAFDAGGPWLAPSREAE